MLYWPPKDPNDIADFALDWYGTVDEPGQLEIDGDTIAASVWILPPGITQDSASFNQQRTTIWLSGGIDGESYDLTNRITTAGGRSFDQSVRVKVKQR